MLVIFMIIKKIQSIGKKEKNYEHDENWCQWAYIIWRSKVDMDKVT